MGWRAGVGRVVGWVLPREGRRPEGNHAAEAAVEELRRQGAVNYRRVDWGASLATGAFMMAFAAALAKAFEYWQVHRWGMITGWNLQNWIMDHVLMGLSVGLMPVCVMVLASARSGRRRGISWQAWLTVLVASVPLACLVATGAILEWHYATRGGREPAALLDMIYIASLLARCVLLVAGVIYAASLVRLWRWRLAALVAGWPLAFAYLTEAADESAGLLRNSIPTLTGIAHGLKAITGLWGGNLVVNYIPPLIFCVAAAVAAQRRHEGTVQSFLPQNRRWRVFWALAVLVVLVTVVGDQVWVRVNRRIPLGWETTRITAPLTADGYPDYLAAINALESKGMTRENNAAIVMSEILEFSYQTEAMRKATFAIWGVSEPGARPFEEYYSWLAREGPAGKGTLPYKEMETAMSRPWSAEEHPALARWVAAMEPALTRMEVASRRSEMYVPELTRDGHASGDYTEDWNYPLPLGGLTELTKLCAVRAQSRLQEGDESGFAHDLVMTLRLGRVLAHSGKGYLEGAYMYRVAASRLQAGAASGRLGAVEAEKLGDELERLGPLPSPAANVNGRNRFYALYYICNMNRHSQNMREGDFESQYLLSWMPLNYERALREENELFDRAVAAFDMASYARRRDAFAAMEKAYRMQVEKCWLPVLHPELMWQNCLGWGQENINYTRSLVEMDLARLALSLCVAHAKEGRYPERLEDLGGAEVVDRFTDKPLTYHRKGEGYELYSEAGASKGLLRVEAAR